jgi:hypothetical protein
LLLVIDAGFIHASAKIRKMPNTFPSTLVFDDWLLLAASGHCIQAALEYMSAAYLGLRHPFSCNAYKLDSRRAWKRGDANDYLSGET